MSGGRTRDVAATLAAAVLVSLAAAGCGETTAPRVDTAAAAAPPTVAAPRARPAPSAQDRLASAIARAGSPVRSVNEAALRELEGAGAAARDAARRALSSPSADARRGAANALARIADDGCAADVIAALRSADDNSAPALILALGRTSVRESGAALVGFIEGPDELRAFRSAAVAAAFAGPLDLARLRVTAACPDHAPHVRASALVALGGHAEPGDHDLFMAASRDAIGPVREAAARGLFESGRATEDDVRRLVVTDESERVRTAAAQAAHVLGAVAIAPLAEALGRFRDDDTVSAAIKSLAAIREPAAFDRLLEFVQDDTQTAGDRGEAVRGLAANDHDRAVLVLKRESAIFDMELRVYCDEILRKDTGR